MAGTTAVRTHERTHPANPYKKVRVQRHSRKLPPGARGMPTPVKEPPQEDSLFGDAPVISRYTREDALEDGSLVDVSEHGREVGFNAPIAITPGVRSHIAVPKGMEGWQDTAGRQHDVLWMAVNAFKVRMRRLKLEGATPHEIEDDLRIVPFKVIFQTSPRRKKTETLWLAFNSYEGFTIMKPEEY